ncbi:MAG: hypothetical protein DRP70_16120 [Spirochaetes bacterium]|nr:MAG: hypothetical protein DRP60_17660 [Spirochaetota bacterium]RKX82614.1 MAG: hypothetical protein DRP70_16120 [Spirochaetota bacterium]
MVSYPAALPRNRESLERLRVQGSALGYDTIHFPFGATVQFKTKISPAFRLAAECYSPAMTGFAPGIALNYSVLIFSEEIDLGFWDGRNHTIPKGALHFTQIEAGVKYRAVISSVWSVEPGLNFGYCYTFSSSEDAIKTDSLLT